MEVVSVSDHGFSPFYMALYEAVDDPTMDSIVSWSKSNMSFIIWDPVGFHTRILSESIDICCATWPWFFDGLVMHGFVRFKSEHCEFGHSKYFVRGQPDLMKKMQLVAYEEYRLKFMEICKEAKRLTKLKAREMTLADPDLATSFTNLSL